jgi:hypothetical protein
MTIPPEGLLNVELVTSDRSIEIGRAKIDSGQFTGGNSLLAGRSWRRFGRISEKSLSPAASTDQP